MALQSKRAKEPKLIVQSFNRYCCWVGRFCWQKLLCDSSRLTVYILPFMACDGTQSFLENEVRFEVWSLTKGSTNIYTEGSRSYACQTFGWEVWLGGEETLWNSTRFTVFSPDSTLARPHSETFLVQPAYSEVPRNYDVVWRWSEIDLCVEMFLLDVRFWVISKKNPFSERSLKLALISGWLMKCWAFGIGSQWQLL